MSKYNTNHNWSDFSLEQRKKIQSSFAIRDKKFLGDVEYRLNKWIEDYKPHQTEFTVDELKNALNRLKLDELYIKHANKELEYISIDHEFWTMISKCEPKHNKSMFDIELGDGSVIRFGGREPFDNLMPRCRRIISKYMESQKKLKGIIDQEDREEEEEENAESDNNIRMDDDEDDDGSVEKEVESDDNIKMSLPKGEGDTSDDDDDQSDSLRESDQNENVEIESNTTDFDESDCISKAIDVLRNSARRIVFEALGYDKSVLRQLTSDDILQHELSRTPIPSLNAKDDEHNQKYNKGIGDFEEITESDDDADIVTEDTDFDQISTEIEGFFTRPDVISFEAKFNSESRVGSNISRGGFVGRGRGASKGLRRGSSSTTAAHKGGYDGNNKGQQGGSSRGGGSRGGIGFRGRGGRGNGSSDRGRGRGRGGIRGGRGGYQTSRFNQTGKESGVTGAMGKGSRGNRSRVK